VSDEVFAEYPLKGDARRAKSALDAADRALVFALFGLSKSAALPQMKLAWTVASGPPALRDGALARLELIADAFLSVSTPIQHAAPALLASGAVARDAIAARTKRNLASLRATLDGSPANVLDVEGGWYATIRLPRTRDDWSLALLERGAYVHPGAFFGFGDEPVVVVSLLTPESALDDGARILRSCADGA
jgi:aspartate/methionine/tyrosine aminotransferase